jgi:hypothetical protein
MQLLLSLIFLFPALSYGQDLNAITKVLQKPVAPGIECTPETLDKNVLQACAVQICGKAGSFPNSTSTGHELDGFKPTPEIQAEIDRSLKLITDAVNTWQAGAKYELGNLKTKLDTSPDIINPEIANLNYILNQNVSYQVIGNKIRVIPDVSSSADPKFKAGIVEWAQGKEKEVQTDPVIRLRLGLNTPEQSMVVLRLKYLALKKEAEALPGNDPRKINFKMAYTEMDTSVKGSDVQAVFNTAGFLDWSRQQLDPPTVEKPRTANYNEPSCKEKCLEGMKTVLSNAALSKVVGDVQERIKKDQPRYLTSCKTGLEMQAKFGQLPGQRKKALALVDSALEKVTALPWWSSHTKEAFIKFVKTEAKIQESFASKDVVTAENVNENSQFQMNKLATNEIIDTVFKLDAYPGNVIASVVPFCPSPGNLTTDSFQYKIEKPLFHVSSYSCEHQGTGEGILAHELGHALSAFMKLNPEKSPESAKAYLRIRSCVTSANPAQSLNTPDGSILAFDGDGNRTEEDTADWLLNKSVKTELPVGCALIDFDKTGQYLDKYLSLVPVKVDPHSSGLLRAIRQVKEQKGKIPGPCEEALAAYKGIVEVKSCN